MRTIVYVDGFNLYYGALRKTPYKWLDLKALFSKLLAQHNQIIAIKYFTARVSSTPEDPLKADHQDAYLRALAHTTPEVRIHLGQFTTHKVMAKLVTPIGTTKFVQVFRTNEKGSDVNLAVQLLNDAWLGVFDCAVVVSGDSDLAQSICLVKTFHTQKKVGLLAMPKRGAPKELTKEVDFVKRISTSALASSLFPDHIAGTSIHKPPDW